MVNSFHFYLYHDVLAYSAVIPYNIPPSPGYSELGWPQEA
jgi:hypothetical protein